MEPIQLDSKDKPKEAIQAYLDTLGLYGSRKNIVFKYDGIDDIKFDRDRGVTFSYKLPNTLEIKGNDSQGNEINIKITLPLKLKLILELNKKLEEYKEKNKELDINNIITPEGFFKSDNVIKPDGIAIDKEKYDEWVQALRGRREQ